MAPAREALQTSWLRVKGPTDERSCAWCRRWVGRFLPVEMGPSYAGYHQQQRPDHPCRCELASEPLKVEAEDPGCAWC